MDPQYVLIEHDDPAGNRRWDQSLQPQLLALLQTRQPRYFPIAYAYRRPAERKVDQRSRDRSLTEWPNSNRMFDIEPFIDPAFRRFRRHVSAPAFPNSFRPKRERHNAPQG